MRITIEGLRTLVLGLGAMVIVALVGFLVVGRYRSRLNIREIPKRLGANIKQEAHDVVYTQTHGGHTLFKIRASKEVQLKESGRVLLHGVQIELYGPDGSRVDRITGNEFEYDQKAGTASAAGPVEISIMRPRVMPAIAPKSAAEQAKQKAKGTPLANMAQTAASGEIAVKTSGVVFDQKSGKATTAQRVQFSTIQGDGSSIGATFDSENGQLILDRAVVLNVHHEGESVLLHAQHAEFLRDQLVCNLRAATANYRSNQAAAGEARILFRQDGSASRLDAQSGFALTTDKGTRITAPKGSIDFDEKNQPSHGRLQDGVIMDSKTDGRTLHGIAPTADLVFTAGGELHHAHLERGVVMQSEQTTPTEGNQPEYRERREWRSPVADLDFRSSKKGRVEIASIKGSGGVIVTGATQRGSGPVAPSRMIADTVTGDFGPQQQLTAINGTGHASMEQTTPEGAHQTITGERITAQLASGRPQDGNRKAAGVAAQIESATVDGNVVLSEQRPAKPGEAGEQTLRATAGHAVYEGSGEWLHLTVNPRIDEGGLQLTADRVDVSQASGDAFARGSVKATWLQESNAAPPNKASTNLGLGGEGPAHVIAAEAQLHRATGEITFTGHARMWQQANSITAPTIVLNRVRQTLVARGNGAAAPVNMVLLSAARPEHPAKAGQQAAPGPEVIRIRAGDLKYSEAERKAALHEGPAGPVFADTGTATTSSSEVQVVLLPPGNHAAPDGGAAQVDRIVARGHVVVSQAGRRGMGEQLVYSSETGTYVLTGTSAVPPRIVDPVHGTVIGESLIFNGRDDSVSIEGPGHKTSAETTAPK